MHVPFELVDWWWLAAPILLGQNFFENLLGGFSQASREFRREQTGVAERRAELENRILLSLAQSPDPEIATLAVAGLVGPQTQAKGKKGLSGLAGFITEVEGNPVLEPLRRLIQTERGTTEQVPDPSRLPSAPITGVAQAPPGGGPVAEPGVSPTRPGAAGLAPRSPIENVPGQSPQITPQPVGPTAGGPGGSAIPPQVSAQVGPLETPTTTVFGSEPRQIFRGPGDIAREQAVGQAQGTVAGIQAAGLPAQQEQAAILGALGAPQRALQGMNVIFADGTTGVVTQMPDGSFVDAAGQPRQDISMILPNQAFSGGGGSVIRENFVERDGQRFKQFIEVNSGQVVAEVPAEPRQQTPPFQAQTFGTARTADGRIVTIGQDRGGNLTVLGGAAQQDEPPSVAVAQGILAAVEAEVANISIGGRLPPTLEQINQIVREQSVAAGARFQSLAELRAAAAPGVQRPQRFEDVVGQPFTPVDQSGVRGTFQRDQTGAPRIDFDAIRDTIQRNRDRLNTPR